MKESVKNILTTVLFAAFIAVGALSALLLPDADFSESERRKLEQFPEITWKSVLDTSAMSKFETYTLDQFPLRDGLRRIKSMAHYYLFAQRDNNDIYLADGSVSKLEYPLKEHIVAGAADKFDSLYEKYFADLGVNAYYSVIPDKNYFLAEENGYPALDYDRLLAIMDENIDHLSYIDLFPYLGLEDYYRTDTHWKQECIGDAADALLSGMGLTPSVQQYTQQTHTPFFGVYYGQAALPMAPDTLTWLENDMLSGCTVYDYETGKTGGIYDLTELESPDPYETFLYGAAALLTIENPDAQTDRELVIFRDSFGSSIAPLLVKEYARITLVDIRYVQSDYLGQIIDFAGTDDVLFLYSTMILNNATMLK
ncbi:MAG: hypothetical protein IJD06_04985 [Clostridia bacterium]|nr:hypothetical protein [Clostridia bacterium]